MRKRKCFTSVALSLLVFLLVVQPASAAPNDSRKKQAKRLKAQVTSIDRRLSIAVEGYNQAQVQLSKTQAEIRANTQRISKAERDLVRNKYKLNDRVRNIYKRRDSNLLEVVLGSKNFDDFLARLDLLLRVATEDARLVKKITLYKKEIERRKTLLKQEEREKKSALAHSTQEKSRIEKECRRRESLLANVEGEIRQIAQREIDNPERLRNVSRDGNSAIRVSRGAPRSSHGGVVGIAMQQTGKPYRYGAAGPSAFDCSGLVQYCYAQKGVSLPHSSRAQYGCGTHVSRNQLQAGDLVFFGSPIHHVGIYVGGGNYIHAPHTGSTVRVAPLNRRDYAGATRL